MKKLFAFVFSAFAASAAFAQLEVSNAWARPTVQGQQGTGAFMTLRSAQAARVIGATSPVAGVTEIHEMKMEGTTMRMRAVAALDLPAGKNVALEPGGYHVMLLDLKRPLKVGEKIPLELRVETADKKVVTQSVEIEVRSRAPGKEHAGHKH